MGEGRSASDSSAPVSGAAILPDPHSPRLRYQALGPAELDHFHHLARDPHIKRYLLDGETVPREWCEAELERSQRLFRARGVGLWLVWERPAEGWPSPDAAPIGFAGFRIFEEMSPEVQLVYAFRERVTGWGYATECGRALLKYASRPLHPGFSEMLAGVDAPNRASIRVLEKLGFVREGSVPGAFGPVLLFRWQR